MRLVLSLKKTQDFLVALAAWSFRVRCFAWLFSLACIFLASACHSGTPSTSGLSGREFSLLVYNVENLFDVDGEALFSDYQPPSSSNKHGYTPCHFLTKLTCIVDVLASFAETQGPEIILFQEFEADRTTDRWDGNLERFLERTQDLSVERLLTTDEYKRFRFVPVQAWLYKLMREKGLGEYQIAVGAFHPDPLGRTVAHVNAVFSRFPMRSVRTHPTEGARGILEVKLDIEGVPLIVFDNHWKSGAANPRDEAIRIGNATVLRARLDELLHKDPYVDFIVAGDFNSHYNQAALFPEMKTTALNTILKSQGDEIAIQNLSDPSLYNLWFELPPRRRFSETHRGKLSTLMQILLPRGLYDYAGIQYEDGSFHTVAIPGLNAYPVSGTPIRWQSEGCGGGCSDHLPVTARFKKLITTDTSKKLRLRHPSRDPQGPSRPQTLDYSAFNLSRASKFQDSAGKTVASFPSLKGRIFRVEGVVSKIKPLEIEINGRVFPVWSFDPGVRKRLSKAFSAGDRLQFYGKLDRYDGRWQFVIEHSSWLIK